MDLKTLLIKGMALVVALALGLGACAIAYAAIEIAWLALGIGVLVTVASAWRLLSAPIGRVALAPVALEEAQILAGTNAGELVDLSTACGQAKFAHDLEEDLDNHYSRISSMN
jgi:predicted signal transduction protein with EAL and GGDEF domain